MKIKLASSEADMASCFALRNEVFVMEQAVPVHEEIDGRDEHCTHFLASDEGGPFATARLMAKGDAAKIQRVAVLQSHRGTGQGQRLMKAIIDHARDEGFAKAVLDSQTHALGFYEALGFIAEGPEFLDAGIAHRHMVLTL